jgi:hypothetical protein
MNQDRQHLTSVGSPVLPASMHRYVDNTIKIKIFTFVPPHVYYDFDGTKLLKDLPSLIRSKLKTDMDFNISIRRNGAFQILFNRSILKGGTLKEDQDIDTITIAEYFDDKPKELYVILVPKQ